MTIDYRQFVSGLEAGRVDPLIFHDEEIYRLELERVFRRSWLFVAHESMLPQPGDYVAQYMGEEPVIVVRDRSGRVRVYLNRCRHRGVQLCPHDRGRAQRFTCAYHGWTYGLDGALVDVPDATLYGSDLACEQSGLIEVPKVASYAGFVFANWDAGASSLDAYLGDLRFYFDVAFGRQYAGGVEMSPIKQRVISRHNWKIAADNGSDLYHFSITHGGGIGTLQDYVQYMVPEGFADATYLVMNASDTAPAHSLLIGKILADPEGYDLHMAAPLGAESSDYVRKRYRAMREAGIDARVAPGWFTVGGLFPNLLLVDMGPLSAGIAIELWHPRGPRSTETWVYVFVEKEAPAPLKQLAARQMMRFHSFSGSVVPDDQENWERLDRAAGGVTSRRYGLNYAMGLNGIGAPAGFVLDRYRDLPGRVTYGVSEDGARAMYRHWATLMQEA